MSSFGTLFKVTTYGESHCRSVGCIVEGCPPGMNLAEDDVQVQLTRRRPGQSNLTTPRNEKDRVHIQSGTEFGVTLGSPIGMMVLNQDQKPHDYSDMDNYPRPSHADFTYLEKYGVKASSGGGRSSARETIGRVAGGAIAEKYLREAFGIEFVAFVSSVGKIAIPLHQTKTSSSAIDDETDDYDSPITPEYLKFLNEITREEVDKTTVRCPHAETANRMSERIARARDSHDSIGGTVTCVIRNVPSGLGEPCFDKIEAKLAHAMMSIPATKSFEIGSGREGCKVPGSAHNDPFVRNPVTGKLGTSSNNSGGVQGGITNGENIYFTVGFKSPATIGKEQPSTRYDGSGGVLAAKGRHDPCVVPRAIPIVETMAALAVMDALMIQQSRNAARSLLPNAL
ncbi:chorismate synthase [Schizosaccharomyces cryophilus OY26]|uniref:Chorismate synthase n=1 Tax=Schizosaccharomyces cryophilus (strain OY26 / ATCC MYA-4695 / CBS 11777 / NBRC 106824 / NRRL Y48691) TaxID=653667 RepID=S9XEC5_SCHCR|nr:chorismate synthase [Schizosaccharomyces cryophilus OY26]EPY52131.1 chorismate synthase [Schizosaccharomyces cryophilus OY26]